LDKKSQIKVHKEEIKIERKSSYAQRHFNLINPKLSQKIQVTF